MISDGDLTKLVTDSDWFALVEAVAEGQLSMLDVMRSNRPEDGDYYGYIQCARAFKVLMQDTRILRRLISDITAVIESLSGGKRTDDLTAATASKDGLRRFIRMSELHTELANTSPSLLNKSTFEECLIEYLKVTGHLEKLWTDSRDFYLCGRYPFATFTAILLLEEMGKVGLIWHELMAYDSPRSGVKVLSGVGRSHRQKAFIAVVAGAVVNPRLDRILGLKAVQQAIHDTESGKLELIRQACLYVDHVDGSITTPREQIGQDQAKFFVIFVGEIWAETYGNFPFEFARMIKMVSEFETELGYSRDQIYGKPGMG